MYLPLWLPSEVVQQYSYIVYFAVAVQKELFDVFFVCAEMYVFQEYTAFVSIVFRIRPLLAISRFLLLVISCIAIFFGKLIRRLILASITLLLLLFSCIAIGIRFSLSKKSLYLSLKHGKIKK